MTPLPPAQRPARPGSDPPRDAAHDCQAHRPTAPLRPGERDAAHTLTTASADPRIASVAEAQHGAITTRQLLAAGLGRGGIAHRVARRRLTSLHRGVYLVGPALEIALSREMAAVLACGPDAVLSHRSAAVLWRLLARDRAPALIDVTVPGRDRRRKGIRVHRAGHLHASDRATTAGIPLTAPARTLVDVAASVDHRELSRALEQALILRLARPTEIRDALARAATARGSRALRALLRAAREPRLTRSEAEARILELIRASGLPLPRTNVRVAGYEVDLHWPRQRLIVEVDGYAFHGTREAFERDRRRDQRLQLAGWRVLRVTWRQIVEEPLSLVVRLARLLEAPAG